MTCNYSYTHIGVPFTKDYTPLIAQIDELANECKTSRSEIIRAILCEFFEFTPKKTM